MANNNNIVSYRQKCMEFGVRTNHFLLSKVDKERVEKIVLDQIDLLGCCSWLYERIDKNMKCGKFDPFFLREHCQLFAWRESFFDRSFPGDSWFTAETDQYGEEEDYFSWDDPFTRFITIPVQLTHHFDTVIALATAKIEPELVVPEGSIVGHSLREHYDQVNLTFSDVAHIIVEVYQKGPKKLEELAIKTILKNRISTDQLPVALQKKIVNGMYAIKDNTPDNITNEGKVVFEKMRKVFSKNSFVPST